MINLTWDDIDTYLDRMISRAKEDSISFDNVSVWGVPRGGSIVAGLLRKKVNSVVIVDDPGDADIIVDDVIDSGATQKTLEEKYKLPFFALMDKLTDRTNEWVHFPWEESPEQDIEMSVSRIIQWLGEDQKRDGLLDTPKRVARSWKELFGGYQMKPESIMRWFEDDTDEMVISKDIQFYSTCEHHMLPFFGTASVGYIPEGKVLGISKLSRIVDMYARRFQTQEHLTKQIATALESEVSSVAVHVKAQHLCMMARGVSQQQSTMITNYLTGFFRDKPEVRNEFLMAVQ